MTITEHRTATTPSWLDLDAIVPPQVRTEAAEITAELGELEARVADLAERAHHLIAAADLAASTAADEVVRCTGGEPNANDVHDGVAAMVRSFAGTWALFDTLLAVSSHGVAVTECLPNRPAWYVRLHPNGHDEEGTR